MATGERTLSVRILGDVANLQKALGSVTQSMSVLGTVAGVAASVGIYQAVQAASDLEEQTNKVSVVFGESAEDIMEWSKSSAVAMGISQREAVGMAGTFGALFTTMGLGQKQAAELSKDLIQLASDMASFNNANPQDALNALRAGLVGEQEPLRRFGVRIDEASIKLKAMEMGLIQNTKAIDPASRAQAAYALIMEQTTVQAGDFERTSESLANQQRTFTAQVDNAKVALGEGLLPAMTTVMQTGNGLLGMFIALPDGIKQTTGVVLALATAAAIAKPKLDAFSASMLASSAASGGRFTGALGKSAAFMAGPWGLAIMAGVGLLGYFASKSREAGAAQNEMAEAIDYASDMLSYQNVQNLIGTDNFQALLDSANKYGIEADVLAKAILGEADAMAEVDSVMQGLIDSKKADAAGTDAQAQSAQTAITAYATYWQKVNEAKEAVSGKAAEEKEAGEITEDVTDDVQDAVGAYEELTAALTETKKAYDALMGVNLDYDEVMTDAKRGLAELRQELNKGTKTLTMNTEEGRNNRDAMREQIKAAWDIYEVTLKKTGSEQKATKAANEHIDAVRTAALAAGFEKDEVDKLIKSLGLVPNRKGTKFEWPGLAGGIDDVDRLRSGLDKIPPKFNTAVEVTTYVTTVAGRRLPDVARAQGGMVWGPGTETSDSIPAMLSRGEFVVRARAVRKYGRGYLEALNRGMLPGTIGLAGGGAADGSKFIGGGDIPINRLIRILDRNLQRIANEMSDVKDELKSDVQARKELIKGGKQEAQGSLSDMFGAANELGGGFVSGAALTTAADARVKAMKRFMSNMKALKGKLPQPLLRELLAGGLDQGLQMSDVLVANPGVLDDMSKSYRQLGRMGEQLGRNYGNAWYSKDIRQGRRELDELRKERDRFERARKMAGKIQSEKIEIHVNVHGNVVSEKKLVDKMIPAIRDGLKRDKRRRGDKE